MLLIMDKKEKKHNPKSHKRLIDKNVNEETVNYYLRIATTLDEGFEGDDDKGMLGFLIRFNFIECYIQCYNVTLLHGMLQNHFTF